MRELVRCPGRRDHFEVTARVRGRGSQKGLKVIIVRRYSTIKYSMVDMSYNGTRIK